MSDEQQLSVAERKARAEATIAANEQRIAQLEARSKGHALKNEFAQVEAFRREIASLQAGIENMRVLLSALDELAANSKAEAKRVKAAYAEADEKERELHKALDEANARLKAAYAELDAASKAQFAAKNAQEFAFSALCRRRAELDANRIDFPELHNPERAA